MSAPWQSGPRPPRIDILPMGAPATAAEWAAEFNRRCTIAALFMLAFIALLVAVSYG